MTPADPLAVAIAVASVLESLGIRYMVGGSVAASVVGEPRSTLDLDIMIDCGTDEARLLAQRLSESCYVDEATAVAAVAERRSFNAIHYDSSMKIDFFVAEAAAFARDALAHRRSIALPGGPSVFFYSAEDLVVRKLLWFRRGGEVSERQWRDVIGILRLNRDLDRERMQRSAADAGVADLLARAIAEVSESRLRPGGQA